MVTSTPKNHVVELTKFAPLLLAELTGIQSLLWGGTLLRMFTFNTCQLAIIYVPTPDVHDVTHILGEMAMEEKENKGQYHTLNALHQVLTIFRLC